MGHTRGVASISFDGHRILSGGSDCSIRLHDFESEDPMAESLLTPNIYGRFQQTSKCVTRYGYRTAMSENHPISTNSDLVRTVQMDSRFAIVGSYDRSVKIINPTDGNLLCNILGAHSNAILHLQFDAYRVITSSQDGQIKVSSSHVR